MLLSHKRTLEKKLLQFSKKDVICSDRYRNQALGRVPADMEEENGVKDTVCTGKPAAQTMKNRSIFFIHG